MYHPDYPFSFSSQPTPYTDSQILEKGTTEYKKGITNYFIELISGQKETSNMMNVCYRTEYKNYSQEELRIADYLIKKRNQASNSSFNFLGNNTTTNISGPFFKRQFDPSSIFINNGGLNNNMFSASTPVNNSPFSLLNTNNTTNNNPFNLKHPFSNNIFNSNNQQNTAKTNPFLLQSNSTNNSNNTNYFNSNFNFNANNNNNSTTKNGSNIFTGFFTNNKDNRQNPFILQANNIQTNNNSIFSNSTNNNSFNLNGSLNNNQNNTNIFLNNSNNNANENSIFQNNNVSIFNQPIFPSNNNVNNTSNILYNFNNSYSNYSTGGNANPFFINGENRKIDPTNFIHYHCCPIIPRSSIGEQQIMKLNEINNELYLERNKIILGISDEDIDLSLTLKNDSV